MAIYTLKKSLPVGGHLDKNHAAFPISTTQFDA